MGVPVLRFKRDTLIGLQPNTCTFLFFIMFMYYLLVLNVILATFPSF